MEWQDQLLAVKKYVALTVEDIDVSRENKRKPTRMDNLKISQDEKINFTGIVFSTA